MALLTIPLRGDTPNFDFDISLDNVVFHFEFQWNERCSCWTFNLSDSSGNLLAGSIQVVVNWAVLARFKSSSMPAGALFFNDMTGAGLDPGAISDLGSRVVLFYQEASTL